MNLLKIIHKTYLLTLNKKYINLKEKKNKIKYKKKKKKKKLYIYIYILL